jgi:hypothetical protein
VWPQQGSPIDRSVHPFAPVDSACGAFYGQLLDEEILRYHIVLGEDVYSDETVGDLKTLHGATISCRHEFCKTYADDALIGPASNHTGGSKYPADVRCENGIIQAINCVLVPGSKAAGAEDGPVSRRPEQYYYRSPYWREQQFVQNIDDQQESDTGLCTLY